MEQTTDQSIGRDGWQGRRKKEDFFSSFLSAWLGWAPGAMFIYLLILYSAPRVDKRIVGGGCRWAEEIERRRTRTYEHWMGLSP